MEVREPKKRNRKKYFIIAGAVLILALLFMLPASLNKVNRDAAGNQSDSTAVSDADGTGNTGSGDAASGAAPASASPQAVIFCASDYQEEPGWDTPANNLAALLDAANAGLSAPASEGTESGGAGSEGSQSISKSISAFIMCGDYTNDAKLHDYQLSPDDSIAEIRSIVNGKAPDVKDEDMFFVQGNHDAMTDSITASGLHEYDDYLVYVLNTQNDFPWKQGKTSGALNKVKASSEALDKCLTELAEKGEKRPVIIAGHVPLHFTARTSSRHTTGDNMYSSLIFNAVNKAGNDLDIIYLFGHNHSKGWDCYMGGSCIMRKVGDKILIPQLSETAATTDDFTEETLNFTYMNAGYTGYYMNCGPEELNNGTWKDYDAADTALTGTVLEIYADRIEISRYAADGLHRLSSAGEGNPYKGGIDAGLIDPSKYGTDVESPQTVARKAVQ